MVEWVEPKPVSIAIEKVQSKTADHDPREL
jgi:hypothetical protein